MPALGIRLVIGESLVVAMPNQRAAMRHWREALQIAIEPRLVGREPSALEAKRRYGSAGDRELVSDGLLRKFLPARRSKRAVANGTKI